MTLSEHRGSKLKTFTGSTYKNVLRDISHKYKCCKSYLKSYLEKQMSHYAHLLLFFFYNGNHREDRRVLTQVLMLPLEVSS